MSFRPFCFSFSLFFFVVWKKTVSLFNAIKRKKMFVSNHHPMTCVSMTSQMRIFSILTVWINSFFVSNVSVWFLFVSFHQSLFISLINPFVLSILVYFCFLYISIYFMIKHFLLLFTCLTRCFRIKTENTAISMY